MKRLLLGLLVLATMLVALSPSGRAQGPPPVATASDTTSSSQVEKGIEGAGYKLGQLLERAGEKVGPATERAVEQSRQYLTTSTRTLRREGGQLLQKAGEAVGDSAERVGQKTQQLLRSTGKQLEHAGSSLTSSTQEQTPPSAR